MATYFSITFLSCLIAAVRGSTVVAFQLSTHCNIRPIALRFLRVGFQVQHATGSGDLEALQPIIFEMFQSDVNGPSDDQFAVNFQNQTDPGRFEDLSSEPSVDLCLQSTYALHTV